jgi:Protein of unknown function (DUF3386)
VWAPLAGLLVLLAAGDAERTPAATDRYFPFRLGDSWTYDWKTEGRVPHTGSRTRTFEGVEFVGGGPAFKLVSDDGTYHVYSLRDGALYLNSSAQDGRVLYYDPPVPLFAPDLATGQPRTTENPATGRRFRTTLLAPEDVPTPLGVFERCLKVRLEMDSADYTSDSYHYFAPDVGLVAYQYELVDAKRRKTEVKIDARLRLARLAGVPVSDLHDVEKLARRETLSLGGKDDASARTLLKRATERRYTWDDKFPGFQGDFEYREGDGPPVSGRFAVNGSFRVTVEAPTEAAQAAVRNQISSFVTFRRFRAFDEEHAATRFSKGRATPDGDVEITAEGDPMATRYLLHDGGIREMSRSAGRVRFTVVNRSTLRTEDGRTIAVAYDLTYYSNQDHSEISRESTTDSYARVGAYWLPTGRTMTRKERGREASSLELRLSHLQ